MFISMQPVYHNSTCIAEMNVGQFAQCKEVHIWQKEGKQNET